MTELVDLENPSQSLCRSDSIYVMEMVDLENPSQSLHSLEPICMTEVS